MRRALIVKIEVGWYDHTCMSFYFTSSISFGRSTCRAQQRVIEGATMIGSTPISVYLTRSWCPYNPRSLKQEQQPNFPSLRGSFAGKMRICGQSNHELQMNHHRRLQMIFSQPCRSPHPSTLSWLSLNVAEFFTPPPFLACLV